MRRGGARLSESLRRDVARLLMLVMPALFVIVRQETCRAVEIAPLRYSVDAVPGAYVPYAASHPPDQPNEKITRILVSIHSSGFDALQYYENAREAASRVPGALQQTLIVAPQFFEKDVVPGRIPENLLFWRTSPYRGSARAAVGPAVKPLSHSAYAVVDEWLTKLTDRSTFRRVKEVVLVGHSAGGQFVQRYAMVGKFEPPAGVKIRFVVSAPSSYAYTSDERYNFRENRFVVPDAQSVQACQGYNNWGYGLAEPYGYFAKADLDAIAEDFATKRVFYLCGSKDIDPNDKSIGRSCGAMMQGQHRLQRMQVYAGFLEHRYGKSVLKNHRFAIVRGVGHYGKGTMTSAAGLHALFAPIR